MEIRWILAPYFPRNGFQRVHSLQRRNLSSILAVEFEVEPTFVSQALFACPLPSARSLTPLIDTRMEGHLGIEGFRHRVVELWQDIPPSTGFELLYLGGITRKQRNYLKYLVRKLLSFSCGSSDASMHSPDSKSTRSPFR